MASPIWVLFQLQIFTIHHWGGESEAKAEGALRSIERFHWQWKDEEAHKMWLRLKNEVGTKLKDKGFDVE